MLVDIGINLLVENISLLAISIRIWILTIFKSVFENYLVSSYLTYWFKVTKAT